MIVRREGHAYADWLNSRGLVCTRTHEKYGYIPAGFRQTTWWTDRAIDFMKEKRTGPSLMNVNCSKARPPREFNGKLAQAKYWAQIELIDDNVGRMLDCLNDTGQLDRTAIVFTSDHGLLKKGCRFYESLVRVPLIMSWPGRFKEGLRSNALVELADIAPTLLDLSELPGAEEMHGRSLVPILTGAAPAGKHRDFVRTEYYRALDGVQSFATMIRNERYKLAVYHGHGLGELFDLQEDPGEFNNLWDDPGHAGARFDLMRENFDALAFAVDVGSERVGRY